MLIALPNQDKSFTVTLFMPTESFEQIRDETSALEFFEENFPDIIPIIGQDKLLSDYLNTPASPLISIKCNPYHWKDRSVLLGDAAHAMVPFYGQGMNCGMEDVLVLESFFDKYPGDRAKAFEEYSKHRNPDAEAIVDLAMYNYIEMRDLVAQPSFLLRKKLDNLLNALFPNWWIPLYTTVTFSRMRYHQCISNKKWQDETLDRIGNWLYRGTLVLGAGFVLKKMSKNQDRILGQMETLVSSVTRKVGL